MTPKWTDAQIFQAIWKYNSFDSVASARTMADVYDYGGWDKLIKTYPDFEQYMEQLYSKNILR